MALINVMSFCLPLALFIFWSILGYSVINILTNQRHILQNLLLAPTLGLGTSLLFVFWLNRFGLPVRQFASILFIIFLSFSLILLMLKRSIIPIKRYLPFFIVIIISLILVGRPLLEFGFDWLSFSNDDMTNYVLGALRFLDHGFFDLPNVNEMASNKNYSLYYWLFYVYYMIRPGSELILAWVAGITSLTPLQIFMPTIIALHLILISATMAMIYSAKRYYFAAIMTGVLLGLSPLNTLATLSQLIAQVSGLSLLIGSCIIFTKTLLNHRKPLLIRDSLLMTVIISSLLITYPEILPFFAIFLLIFFVLKWFQFWSPSRHRHTTIKLLVTLVLCAVFLNSYIFNFIHFLILQIQFGSTQKSLMIFYYYYLPSGLANLWGLQALSVYPKDLLMTTTIIIGGVLLCFVYVSAIVLSITRASIAGMMTFIMISVSIYFFRNSFDFGLFKLAMYVQPFLIATLVISLFTLFKNYTTSLFIVLTLIILMWPIQNLYVGTSRALMPGGSSEIAYASNSKIIDEYKRLIAPLSDESKIISADFNQSLLKLLAFSSLGKDLDLQITNPFFQQFFPWHTKLNPSSNFNEFVNLLQIKLDKQYKMETFKFHDHFHNTINAEFVEYTPSSHPNPKKTFVIADTAKRSVINKSQFLQSIHNFALLPWPKIQNLLIFVSSSLGSIYCDQIHLFTDKRPNSLFNLEKDYYYPDQVTQAVNRYLLFRIINPTPKARLKINITNSWFHDGENKLPDLFIVGENRVSTSIMGRGSARIFSKPVSPQWVNKLPYLLIDMNREGQQFKPKKSKILTLYGKTIQMDQRNIVTVARDISLVTENEYEAINPPSYISKFPADLNNPNLEYSGIYEDGWVSENAYFKLSQSTKKNILSIKGVIPMLHDNQFMNAIKIIIDGKPMYTSELKPGNFDIKIFLADSKRYRTVECHFSKTQRLPGDDGRPIAAKLNYIGFD